MSSATPMAPAQSEVAVSSTEPAAPVIVPDINPTTSLPLDITVQGVASAPVNAPSQFYSHNLVLGDLTFTSADLPGKVLAYYPIHPRLHTLANQTICNIVNYWTGSLVFQIKANCNALVAGMFGVAVLPSNIDPTTYTPQDFSIYNYALDDFREQGFIEIPAFDMRTQLSHVMTQDMPKAFVNEVNSAKDLYDMNSFGGWFVVYINNPLNVNPTVVQQYSMTVRVRLGMDMQFLGLRPPPSISHISAPAIPSALSDLSNQKTIFGATVSYLTFHPSTTKVVDWRSLWRTVDTEGNLNVRAKNVGVARWDNDDFDQCITGRSFRINPSGLFLTAYENNNVCFHNIPLISSVFCFDAPFLKFDNPDPSKVRSNDWSLKLITDINQIGIDLAEAGFRYPDDADFRPRVKPIFSPANQLGDVLPDWIQGADPNWYEGSKNSLINMNESLVTFDNTPHLQLPLHVQTEAWQTMARLHQLPVSYAGRWIMFEVFDSSLNLPITFLKLSPKGYFTAPPTKDFLRIAVKDLVLKFYQYCSETSPFPVSPVQQANLILSETRTLLKSFKS
jgi:hypothetical protein